MHTYLPLLGFFLALAYSIVFALRLNKNQSGKQFFFGNHALTEKEISYSLFSSWMSVGNVIVAALILTISYGYLALWAVFTWFFGFLILSRHAEYITKAAAKFVTIHSFLRKRYASNAVGQITSILTLITACGVITLELMVGAAIFNASFGAENLLITTCVFVCILATIAVLYTRKGGLGAVLKTDRVQALAIFSSLVALVLIIFLGQSSMDAPLVSDVIAEQLSVEPKSDQLFSLLGFVFGFGALQLFLLLGDMATWQRIQLGASAETVKRAAVQASLQNLIGWGLLFGAGMLLLLWPADAVQFPVVSGTIDQILSTQAEPLNSIMSASNASNPILHGILLVVLAFGLVSAILSTCDTFLLLGSQAIVFEWSKKGKKIITIDDLGEHNIDSKIGKQAKSLVVLVMVAALVLFLIVSVLGLPLVSVLFLLLAAQTTTAPLAILALYHPNSASKLGGVATGAVSCVLITIFILLVLSGTASTTSLSYAYAYLAPIAAIFIPVIAFAIFGIFSPTHRKLIWLLKDMLVGRRESIE